MPQVRPALERKARDLLPDPIRTVLLTAEELSRATGEPLLSVQRWLKAAFGPAPRGHHRKVSLDQVARALAVTPEALAGLLGAGPTEREAA